MERWRAYEQELLLKGMLDGTWMEVLCWRCNGMGGWDVGENQNPGGTGVYDWQNCENCGGDGTVVLKRIRRKKDK